MEGESQSMQFVTVLMRIFYLKEMICGFYKISGGYSMCRFDKPIYADITDKTFSNK